MRLKSIFWAFVALAAMAAIGVRFRSDLLPAARDVLTVGWILIPTFGLFLIWNHIAAYGWRDLVIATEASNPPSAWQLGLARIEAQALNLLLPASGEVVRASRMSGATTDVARSGTLVLLDV